MKTNRTGKLPWWVLLICLIGCTKTGLSSFPSRVSAEATVLPVNLGNLETRRLIVEWPKSIRLGDTARISMDIKALEGFDPDAVFAPLDIYTRFNILAEATLVIPRLLVTPAGCISQPFSEGRDVPFMWYVRPDEVGSYEGTTWVKLQYAPRRGEQQRVEVLIAAVPIEIRVVSVAGISATKVRVMGVIGLFAGTLFALPYIAYNIDRTWRERTGAFMGKE